MNLKSVSPLFPPKVKSLRKNISDAAYVRACVRIEKYTPLMRDRNARNPKTNATKPGTTTVAVSAKLKLRKGIQCGGRPAVAGKREGKSRKTMKSGKSLLYCPNFPIIR